MAYSRRILTVMLVVCATRVAGVDASWDEQLPTAPQTIANDAVVPPDPLPVFSRDSEGRATVRAVRLTEPLVIDGSLDESIYQTLPPITELFQQVPDEGSPATEKTEIWVTFDAANIYVTARCWDSAPPDEWVANDYRRDSFQMKQNDTFGVSFDTFFDRRNGFVFYTNPLGARVDYAVIDEGTNFDWNPVWDARPGRFEGGWTVEMQIPFKSLRYKSGAGQLWGIQLRRVVRRKNEWSYIARVPQSAAGPSALTRVSYAATLTGLELPDSSRNVELKPYVISRLATDHIKTPALINDTDADVGGDVKYSVTANLTADFTYNTDFAQVEVDEQQVNLTRFNLVFPEKREFFLEGRGLFDFGKSAGGMGAGGASNVVPNLFYTRRIGLEAGGAVPINFGGRLTGKSGPFGIGMLNIQTGTDEDLNAVSTNFTVLRLKRDVLRRSSIGGIFTNRSHSVTADGSNQAYGVDGNFLFYDSINVSAYYAGTQTPTLEGENASYQARFAYNADRYGATADHLFVDGNFNPEVGYLQRRDFRRSYGYARFSPRPTSVPHVRKFTSEASFEHILDGRGILESQQAVGRFMTELENGDQVSAEVTGNYEHLIEPFEIADDVTLPVGGYHFNDVMVSYLLGVQHRASGTVQLRRGGFYSGTITAFTISSARVTLTPKLSFDPGVSINHVELPEGTFTAKLLSTRVDYAFPARMFVSGFVQYNSSTRRASSNFRYRWEYRPGSELFVVYTDEHDTGLVTRETSLRNRAFVVKVNRLLRF